MLSKGNSFKVRGVEENMDPKKVGGVLFVLGVILLVVFVFSFQSMSEKSEQLGCFQEEDCLPVVKTFTWVHIGFGVFGFVLALGFYMFFFAKGDKALLDHLDKREASLEGEEKLAVLMLGLDEFEKKVVSEVRKQSGITQSTLRLRADMSKAKLSQVLGGLEKKGLIKREQQKKTLAVFWKLDF